ncbi:MAG: flavodoxin family protein [Dehalococcoidales bacterium]|nr:flavodoxin family protein [Dehalococcoidales bacterium]
MEGLLILDKDNETELAQDLKSKILAILKRKGYQTTVLELYRKESIPCLGCLRCLTHHPGRCVSHDKIAEIKPVVDNFNATVFLTPVIFGHFSSTVKNALDRGLGSRELQVIIGYGDSIDQEEKALFIDLTAKHRGKADIVHPGFDSRVEVFVTESEQQNSLICESTLEYFQNRS